MKTKYLVLMLLVSFSSIVLAAGVDDTKATCTGGTITYEAGTGGTYTLTATPLADFEFLYWEDGTTTTNPRVVTPSGTSFYRAVFAHRNHLKDGDVNITPTDNSCATFTLEAVATCSQSFNGWTNGESSTTITNYSPSATFGEPLAPIFSSVYEKGQEALNGCKVVAEKVDCEYKLTAVPCSGYLFKQWQDDGADKYKAVRKIDYATASGKSFFAEFEPGVAKAQIGDAQFGSLQAAIDAAEASDVIELLADNTEDLSISKAVSIDGGNNTITGDLTIAKDGKLTMDETNTLSITNLYLASEDAAGSQIINTANLTVSGDAYMDITLRAGQDKADGSQWYAVAVPFQVEVNTGVKRVSNGEGAFGTDYTLDYYDGNARATTGKGWKTAQGETMQPGKFYLMGIADNENTWRFQKKSEAALEGADTQALTMTSSASGVEGAEAGWNAAGVSVLHNVNAQVGELTTVLTYNNTNNAYVAQALSGHQFTVGTPFFVQVSQNETLTLSVPSAIAARRASNKNSLEYEVRLSNSTFTDKLYLLAHDDAEDYYVIGRDLAKMRSNTVPQIWTTAYGTNLCVEDQVLTSDAMDYATTMYAPKAGTYTIAASEGVLPVSLWKNGAWVADLTNEATELYLNRGMNNGYTLRVGTIRTQPTQLNQLTNSPVNQLNKMLINGQLMIIRDGKVFNAQGQEVK